MSSLRKHLNEDILRVLDHAVDAIAIDDVGGELAFANGAFRRLFGVGETDPLGRIGDYISPKFRAKLLANHKKRMRGRPAQQRFEFEGRHRDGSSVFVEASVTPLTDPIGIHGSWTIIRDVGPRRERESRLSQAQAQYRDLFESAFEAIVVFEPEFETVLDVNRRACELYGLSREEFVGMSLLAVTRDFARGQSAISSIEQRGHLENYSTVHRHRDGRMLEIECNASLVEYGGRKAILSVNRDVTERRRLQRQLNHAEKMQAIGQLAAGVAHEFNNVLASILGTAEDLLEELDDPATKARLEHMISRATAGAKVTRELLTLSRAPAGDAMPLAVAARIDEMAPSMQRMVGDGIRLRVSASPGDATVLADPAELEQIILNLVVNARDAMPGGGELRIDTALVSVATTLETATGRLPRGDYVRLRVADSGVGIPDDVLPRLFEPFFTTKARTRGTGLGLARVYAIVEGLGGGIAVRRGRGTTFDVLLPATTTPTQRPPRTPEKGRPAKGSETILLVDDEPTLAKAIARGLRRSGYQVLTAADAESALVEFRDAPGRVDLLLTDLSMPDGSGIDAARDLRARQPGLAVIVMSGYADIELPKELPGAQFLQKPFTHEQLRERVREALDGRRRRLGGAETFA